MLRIFALTLALASMGAGCRAHAGPTPLAAALPAGGGLTIVHQDGNQPLQTFYVDSDRIRAEMGDPNSPEIVDARAHRVLYVFGLERTYVEVGPKEVEIFRAIVPPMISKEELEQLDRELEKYSQEQREPARATLSLMAGGTPSYTFERTAAERTIDGVRCFEYRVSLGGEPVNVECISPWSDGLFRREDFAALAAYYRSIKPMEVAGNTIFANLDCYPGFPLTREPVNVKRPDGTIPGSDLPPWENKGIKRGQLPASLFMVPPGFKKKERRPIPLIDFDSPSPV